MSLVTEISELATRIATEFKSVRTALAGKANTTHAHAAGDVTSGAFDIARIPTGTTGTTVAVGNHTHTDLAPTSRTISTTAPLSGGGDLSANRTLSIASASTTTVGASRFATNAEAITGTAVDIGITPAANRAVHIAGTAPATLTDAATIATDASAAPLHRVTIAGNRTLGVPTNAVDGQKAMWEVTASGADRTLTLTTGSTGSFKFGTDITSIPVITSGTTTFIGAIYRSASQRWHVLAVSSGH